MEKDASYQERQENEKVCIEAIYMDDFRDESKKGKKGMAFVLHLMPQQGMSLGSSIHCTADMRVICPPKYPSDPPQIYFENTRGLSEDKVQTLKKQIEKLAKSLKGEEMILQLAQQVQQFLHLHNVPGVKSLFEEMQKKEEKKRERDALLKQKQLEQDMKRAEKERKELEEEMLRRQEALLEESRMRREKNHESETPAPNHLQPKKKRQPDPVEFISNEDSSRTRSSSYNSSWKKSSDVSSNHSERKRTESFNEVTSDSQVIALRFNTKLERNINRGCILEDQEGGQVYIGMDTCNGHLVVLREWQMKWKHGKGRKPLPDEEKSADHCMKQLASVEQELLSLLKLSHPNLVHYLAMNTSQGKDSTSVQLLMEFVGSGTLRNQIRSRRKIPFSILRQYTIDLLAALSYLHKKAVVHKQLSPGSVFIDVSGQLKLANYSLVRRLNDLCEVMSEAKHTVRFSEEKTFGARGGKKADVLKFGLILLAVIKEDADVQMPCELPPDLPPDLQDFLERCLDTDERSRASIHALEEHSFVKDTLPVENAFLVPEKKENDTDSLTREISEEQVSDVRFLGNSRLHQEFEVLGNIGKGGFGNVFRVRNRLDGNAYAIKRIVLNPKSKDLNKKITREVKLLSRLNHENVVRYFNSWIEVSEDILTTDSESDPSVSEKPSKKQTKVDDNLGLADDIEDLAPRLSACGSLSWSVSAGNALSQESSESSSDDDDDFGMSFMRRYSSSDSDGIEFEADGESPDGDEKSQKEISSLSNGTEDVFTDAEISTTKYLYIQMEFCEKSTLRTSIDENLYKDEKRMWRYLREILEGLVHIHSQGMIHRDLKPDNIFLASNDLVKIGDFGLATSEQKVDDMLLSHSFFPESSQSHDVSADAKDFLTGKVGTALYVSPELSRAKGSFYNQKVDLYSLGIIFFEMCMPPLATGMERVQILGKLRQENIEMPENCDEILRKNKKDIIKWLLDHDPSRRPTAHELLESQLLPPLEMEEARFQERIRQTVSNNQSRGFKHLMNQLFSQTPKPMDDILYDVDIHKGFFLKNALIQKTVFETLTSLFERHGAVRVNSPLLLPKNSLLDHNDSCCYFMDSGGSVVALPFDLRIPFARNVARNSINKLKRYTIERVYRERKIHRCHPRELTECAFDIITNVTSTLLPDAEVMYVVSEILEEFPSLEERKVYFIRVNHTLLLQAILTQCGIPEEKHKDVMKILAEVKGTMVQIQTHLQSLSLSEQELNNLFQYVELECSFKELSTKLKPVTRGRGPSAFQAKQALHELESIISQAQIFGVQQKIVVAPSLVHKYFSSFVFQFVARVTRKNKKQPAQEVLAAGGRYDDLIPLFRIPTNLQPPPVPKAVGVSIHFDKIVTSLVQDQSNEDMVVPVCDVLVCVMNSSYSIKECIQVVRNLWINYIKADILYDASMSLEEIQDYCRAFGVSQIVVLKDQLDSGMIWVRSLDREKRVVDSKVNMLNLVEYLQQKLASNDMTEVRETLTTQRSQSFESHLPTSQAAMSSVTILPTDNHKLESNTKRRIERQIQPRIQPVIENLSSKVIVQVVAVDLPMEVVKTMAAILDLEGDDSLNASVKELCNKYNRYRKYIPNIADCIQTYWKSDEPVVVILYSYKEDGFKVLM